MSAERIPQLLISFALITLIAIASERSHVLASFLSVVPINITLTVWFLFSRTGGDTKIIAEYTRMALCGLFPAMLFALTCWLGFRQGWSMKRALGMGYCVWFAATAIYRGLEWWLSSATTG